MRYNRHDEKISAEVLDQAQEKTNELYEMLRSKLVALTPSEKQEMLKMGPKTQQFVDKTFEFARENPELIPKYMSMEEFRIDFTEANGLWALLSRLQQLAEGIRNLQFLAGSEAFRHALLFYNAVKAAAAQDITGASVLYNELRKRFPGSKKHHTEPTTTDDLNEI